MTQRILIIVNDLMFQPRIADAVTALGLDARVPDTAAAAEREIAAGAAGVVVDLHADGIDAAGVIARAKGAGARVLAFGRHTDAAALRAARAAGADRVVPRSQLVEELDELLRALVGAGDAATKD